MRRLPWRCRPRAYVGLLLPVLGRALHPVDWAVQGVAISVTLAFLLLT